MAKKKSIVRKIVKRIFIVLHIVIGLALLYPQFFKPARYIWVNGFITLAMPYLVLGLLLLLIFWLLIKPVYASLSIVFLVVAWPSVSVLMAVNPSNFSLKKSSNYLRIASWNIKEFNGNEHTMPGHQFRAETIANSVMKWSPDIICLQEFNSNLNDKGAANHQLLFQTKYPYSFFSKDYTSTTAEYYAGCIILSRYPIIRSERIAYTNHESLIYVDIQKGDDTIRVYTTHLASYRFKSYDFDEEQSVKANKNVFKKMKSAFMERAVQAAVVKEHLDQSPYPSIITGDFNDVPGSYTYTTIKGTRQDAFLKKGVGIGATFSGLSPTLRIDYILPDHKWDVRAWESIDENLSDHHMILADLKLLKN
jgi:endonuclease/exonuclease/phosphatase family metal-dependent hydrolase